MGYISTLVNTFGGRWLDLNWKPQLTSPAWIEAVSFYVDLLRNSGPPGAITNGYNENRALFANGNCAMWVDATSAASYFLDPRQSRVAATTGFAKAPSPKCPMALPGCGAGRWPSPPLPRAARWPNSSSSGLPAGAISPGWARVSAGCGFPRAHGNPLTIIPIPARRPLRASRARGHSERGLYKAQRFASSLRGDSVRGHSGFQAIGTEVGQEISAALAAG